MDIKRTLEIIRANRTERHLDDDTCLFANRRPECPAYHGPCTPSCFLRPQCTTNPSGVMDLMARLDQQTADALARHI